MINKPTNDEQEVRQAINAWASALCAKDAGAVVGHLAAGCVEFTLAPPLQSKAASRESLEAWFDTWKGPLGYAVDQMEVAADSNLACAYGLCRMTGTKTDGEQVDLRFRQTLCLRKIGGAWRITHQHESVPFYMDGSFRAAVDLQS